MYATVRSRSLGLVDNLAHELGSARIVEPREQHERAKPHELIFVALHRPNQRGRDSRGRGSPQCPRRLHPSGKIEVAERVDRRLNRGVGNRLRPALLCQSSKRHAAWPEASPAPASATATANARTPLSLDSIGVELQRQLQIGCFVARECDRVLTGVAGRAVGRCAACRPRTGALRG